LVLHTGALRYVGERGITTLEDVDAVPDSRTLGTVGERGTTTFEDMDELGSESAAPLQPKQALERRSQFRLVDT
jgi:hypothetical protein